MGLIHRRESAEIRALALETAVKKYTEGCVSCAQSYLALAREHGASASELARAAEQATRTALATASEPRQPTLRTSGDASSETSLGRRKLLRVAATAVAAGVAGNLVFARSASAAAADSSPTPAPTTTPTPSPTAQSVPVPGFWGVDSCTTLIHGLAAGMPLQFYIGEMGATQYGIDCFDRDTAAHVTPAFTHGYWGICGPQAKPDDVLDAGTWGQRQALLAIDAWNNNPVVGGRTLFADIERGFGGWTGSDQHACAALLNAYLVTITQAGFIPGVYLNLSERAAYFPSDYVAPVPFVYWVAGGSLAGKMAGPCQQGDTLHPTFTAWTTSVQAETFGGMAAVVWQYWLSGFGCSGDFNYSPQSGYSAFTPLKAPAPSPITFPPNAPAPGVPH